jgi:predicted ribosomally synthesized peptide with nif11-like leader
MAYQTALAFINKVNGDPALHERVKSIGDMDTLLKTAAEAGFTFTAEEWQQAVTHASSGELSESDLDQVAGGSLNAYFSKVQGEKQGAFKGGGIQ